MADSMLFYFLEERERDLFGGNLLETPEDEKEMEGGGGGVKVKGVSAPWKTF
jgi:hypothetical protein